MAGGKLTAKKVETAKAGRHGDGAGLWLIVSETGAKRWAYRYTIAGRVSEIGLGSYPSVSLADARFKAVEARRLSKAGKSPLEAKREAARANARKPTFGEVADALIEAKAPEWRNADHLQQWRMTLTEYASPLRSKPVDEISTADVLEVLKPLWQKTPETASRLRGRIEAVLDAAKAQGHRTGENPATWRGHLSHLLPKRQKLTKGHHAALPYADVPAFIARLRAQKGLSALGLELQILTACRSGEALAARWDEIDLAGKVWTIPAARTKAGKIHRVPLSGRALEILATLAEARVNQFVLPGNAKGKPLSKMAFEMLMRRMKVTDATPHGFRSAFRDWCGNETSFPREVAEAALAHRVPDATEAAYRRGDALEKRRELMDAWARHCEPSAGGNVIALKRSGGAPA
jgi:integrase